MYRINPIQRILARNRPRASSILTHHLAQCEARQQYWTSFFVPYRCLLDDHFAMSNFYFTTASGASYEILRTGCWPYIKYHCTRVKTTPDLTLTNATIRACKVALWVACPLYGCAAFFLLFSPKAGTIKYEQPRAILYFLIDENKREFFINNS